MLIVGETTIKLCVRECCVCVFVCMFCPLLFCFEALGLVFDIFLFLARQAKNSRVVLRETAD